MEELAGNYTGGNHVCQWQFGGRITGIPEKCAGCIEGTGRMCHLLFCHFDGYADPEQEMCDVQERVPFSLSVPVVQE